jgi:hypothetical protein
MNKLRYIHAMHILGQNLRQETSTYVEYASVSVLSFDSKLHYCMNALSTLSYSFSGESK